MFCFNCGKEVIDNANFCRHCGQNLLIDNEELSHSAESESSPISPTNQQEDMERDLFAFVGKNSDYYKRKWNMMKDNGISWNFAAFFLTFFWLGYRKMYRIIFFFALSFLGVDVLLYLFNYEYDPSEFIDPIDRSIGMGVSVVLGLLGNNMYKKHAEKQIMSIYHSSVDPQDKDPFIRKKGGRSWLGVIIGIIIFIGVYLIPTLFIPYNIQSDRVDSLIMNENISSEPESISMIEEIGTGSIGVPYDEATYEEKVIMLMSFYIERAEEFENRTEQLQGDPYMFQDQGWLNGIYDDLEFMDGIMDSIIDIDSVPIEQQDEALFAKTLSDYEKAHDLLTKKNCKISTVSL